MMTFEVLCGDALEVARGMEPGSKHIIVTSIPYWSKRDYDEQGQLGLEATPEEYVARVVEMFHEFKRVLRDDGTLWLNMGDSYNTNPSNSGDSNLGNARALAQLGRMPMRCKTLKPLDRCDIPGDVVRALRADGWYWRQTIIWYKPNPMPESMQGWRWERHRIQVEGGKRGREARRRGMNPEHPREDHNGKGFQPSAKWVDCPGCEKCLPHGGYVLIKGSGRPTTSHEYIFLLSTTDTYFFDSEAVREIGSQDSHGGGRVDFSRKSSLGIEGRNSGLLNAQPAGGSGRNLRSVWTFPAGQADWEYCDKCKSLYTGKARSRVIRTYFIEVKRGEWVRYKLPLLGSRHVRMVRNYCDANPGWLKFVIIRKCPDCKSTEHWVDHFAAFPLRLPELCIKAGTSEKGVCKKCGAPWVRVVEKEGKSFSRRADRSEETYFTRSLPTRQDQESTVKTLDWLPSCDCDAGEPVPATVLDPFCGSGQTLVAAHKLGRDPSGIDLKRQYCDVAIARLKELAKQGRLM